MASTSDIPQSLLREAHMEMIFSQLLALDQISDRATYDALIPSLLENIGQITHANRAYIFSIHEEEECYYRNAYEWCQDGVTPQIENLQHVPAALIPYWDGTLRRGKAISIWDLETFKDTMPAEYDILHAQDIHGIAVLPIFAAGKFVGFIGLDDPDHSIYDIASKMLQVISGHLGCIRSHLDAQEALSESRARLESQLISLRRETHLVDALASDYRCIVRCNLTQDTFETIKGVPRCPTGTLEPESVPFDIFALLMEANHLTEMQAPAYGVTIHMKNPPFPVRRVIGSPTFLRRVLLNITSNALKYNRRGGRIDLSCDKIEIKGEKAFFTLSCADTGIGMSPSFQSRAFEPFTQELDTARTHYMGTGLGLSIVKEFVSKMGGTITLSSQKGVGTRFTITITIPFTIDHASQEAETASQSPVSLSGLHVLLVEDNELNREIALCLLEKEGMEITTCENGAEAVKAFRESPLGYYDLILMDIMMPVMDGYEASRRIRSLPRRDASLIPIFAMTANAFQDDIEKSHQSGMNEHLTKPLHTKTMLSAIRKYVR